MIDCSCGHTQSDHEYWDGGKCLFCECEKYHPGDKSNLPNDAQREEARRIWDRHKGRRV